MTRKYSQYSNLSKKDRFQITAFKMIFKGMVKNRYTVEEALARGIELTSDNVTAGKIKANPDIVEQWYILNKEGANKREQSKKSKKEADDRARIEKQEDRKDLQKGEVSQYHNFQYGRHL